jgi:protein tyrosine/serine phosphatase
MKAKPTYRVLLVVALLTAGAVTAAALTWQYALRLPKRFAVVVEGRLYRSGSVSPAQLERLQKEYGIRRVICLLNPAVAETQAEQRQAAQLGLEWCNVPLPGNGASTPDDRRELLRLLLPQNSSPTLVHCAAGTYRTSLAVGLYRLHAQNWPLSRVMNEARAFGFEDGPNHENLRQALVEEAITAAGEATSVTTATAPAP